MEWFDGNVGEAIQAAKQLKAIFVVVIHGPEDDEATKEFLSFLGDDSVNSKLKRPTAVCIRVLNGSTECNQFSQIYPVVLVPSIYFIDSMTGVDLEVTGGKMTLEKIQASIDKVLESRKETPAPPTISPADVASPRQERVEHARQVIQNEIGSDSPAGHSTPTSSLSLQERVERAKRLLAEKQAEKAKEAADKEKSDEASRREAGKNLAALKRKQEEDEIMQVARDRQKDKEEERIARQKVKEQIAQDRAERAARFNADKKAREEKMEERERQRLQEEAKKAEEMAAQHGSFARVQFRLPDGSGRTKKFGADEALGTVYQYVIDEMEIPFGSNFSLVTTFPKRDLDAESKDAPLRSLGLVPSGTVLVLPKNRSMISTSGGADGIMGYIWLLLTPITVLWGVISSFIFGQGGGAAASGSGQTPARSTAERKRQAPEASASRQAAQKRRSAGGIRTEGNIARLSADDDDDMNTYNGNSTQQM